MSGEIELEAREMGWRPKEEFRGDTDKWVDAETFVSRGEHFLPILRKDRDTFKARARVLETQVGELQATLTAAQEAIEALKEHQTESTKRQVELARREIISQIKEARESGNVEGEMELQERLDAVKLAQAPAPAKPAAAAPPPPPAIDPVAQAWIEQNPWFEKDARKRGLAMGIADDLRNDPAIRHLGGKAFFEKLDEELSREPAFGAERPQSKVNGGRPTGGSGTPRAGRGYADLPADAKEACDRDSKKLVGTGRAFKDEASWRAHYVKHYFGQEAQ